MVEGQQQDLGKDLSMNEKFDKLLEVLEPKSKSRKKLKLPKLNKVKLKQNYVLVVYIKDNLSIDMKYLKIENEYIYIPETNTYHLATSEYVMNYKGIPTIIQPAWSLEPLVPSTFSPKKHYKETEDANKGSNPQKVLIHLMELSNPKIKGKGGSKLTIYVVVGVVAALYFLTTLLGKG